MRIEGVVAGEAGFVPRQEEGEVAALDAAVLVDIRGFVAFFEGSEERTEVAAHCSDHGPPLRSKSALESYESPIATSGRARPSVSN